MNGKRSHTASEPTRFDCGCADIACPLHAEAAELLALCKRAVNESARVHPDFLAKLQVAIRRAEGRS